MKIMFLSISPPPPPPPPLFLSVCLSVFLSFSLSVFLFFFFSCFCLQLLLLLLLIIIILLHLFLLFRLPLPKVVSEKGFLKKDFLFYSIHCEKLHTYSVQSYSYQCPVVSEGINSVKAVRDGKVILGSFWLVCIFINSRSVGVIAKSICVCFPRQSNGKNISNCACLHRQSKGEVYDLMTLINGWFCVRKILYTKRASVDLMSAFTHADSSK